MKQKPRNSEGTPQKAPAFTKPTRAEKSMKREARTAAENDDLRSEDEEPVDAGAPPAKKRGAPGSQIA